MADTRLPSQSTEVRDLAWVRSGEETQLAFADLIGNVQALAAHQDHGQRIGQILAAVHQVRAYAHSGDLSGQQKAQRAIREITGLLGEARVDVQDTLALYEELRAMCSSYMADTEACIAAGEACLSLTPAPEEERFLGLFRLGAPPKAAPGNELAQRCRRKVRDLQLTRQVMLQSVAKLELLQQNNRVLCEQIDAVLAHMIPLWSLGATLNAGLIQQRALLKQQQAVNELLEDERSQMTRDKEAGQALEGFLQQANRIIAPLEKATQGAAAQLKESAQYFADANRAQEQAAGVTSAPAEQGGDAP